MGNQLVNSHEMPRIDGKAVRIRYISHMDSSVKLPSGHQLVETLDGSWTLFSEAYQEACHSIGGAKAETILHYFEGCKISDRLENFDPMVILEVGFGLGMGFLTTYEMLPRNKKWKFISLEIDRNLLEWFKETNKDHEFLKNLEWKDNVLTAGNDHLELMIIQGDARTELPLYLNKYPLKWHAIYQDAFSPKKNPTLWTKEWFEFLKKHSHREVILSTYSASTSVRKAMHETGWGVQKGEPFGQKRTSTRANLLQETHPEILLQLERSPAPAFTDLQIDSFKLK